MEILKYIQLGTNAKEWFNYDGKPLPIRPLSTYEIDEITLTVIKEGITQSTFNCIIKLKLEIADAMDNKKISIEDYGEFVKYYNEIDYWIVYHAMNDFQPEKFSMHDIEGEFSYNFKDCRTGLTNSFL